MSRTQKVVLGVLAGLVIAAGAAVVAIKTIGSSSSAPRRPAEGSASCVDPVGDVRLQLDNGPEQPASELHVDIRVVELQARDGRLEMRFGFASDVIPEDVVGRPGATGVLVYLNYSSTGSYFVDITPGLASPRQLDITDIDYRHDPNTNEGAGTIATSGTVTYSGPVIETIIPLSDMPRLGAAFDWNSASITSFPQGAGLSVFSDECGTNASRLTFPGTPLDIASSISDEAAPPNSSSSLSSTVESGGDGRALACPRPLPDRLEPRQAADCMMERWAEGDRAGAAAFATGDDAVIAPLFAVSATAAPQALGCTPAQDPPPGDPTSFGAPMACTYLLASGATATAYVDATPSAGGFVFSTSLS